jgi:hypothetical protein
MTLATSSGDIVKTLFAYSAVVFKGLKEMASTNCVKIVTS